MNVRLCNATPHKEELIRRAADVGLDAVPIVAGLIETIQRMDDEISSLTSANEKLAEKLDNAESELREEGEMGGAR